MNEKWYSRKFIVWITWLVFCIISFFVEQIPSEKCLETFGIVSLIYIGANAAQDFAPGRRNRNADDNYIKGEL